jgi:hypothetical protein
VSQVPTPDGLVLAADFKQKNIHELEGDIDALGLIDLDHEGLSEYKQLFKSKTAIDDIIPNTIQRNSLFIQKNSNSNLNLFNDIKTIQSTNKFIKFDDIKSPNSSYVKNINSTKPRPNNRRASSCEQVSPNELENKISNIDGYNYSIYDIKQNKNSSSNIPKPIRKSNIATINNSGHFSQPLTSSHFTTANYDLSNSNISDNESAHRVYLQQSSLNKENSDLFQTMKGSSMPNPITHSFNSPNILPSHIKIRSCIPRLSQSCNLITKNIIPADLMTTHELSSFNPKLNSTSKNQLADSRAPSSCLVTSSIFNNELEKSMNLNNSIGTETSKLLKSIVNTNIDELDLSNNALNASYSSSQYIY